MSLDKRTTIDRIEVLPETGAVQVRQKIAVIETEEVETTDEEGKVTLSTVQHELSFTYHRYVLSQGDDLEGQPDAVKVVAEAVWGIVHEAVE